jgi:hypothetical protein
VVEGRTTQGFWLIVELVLTTKDGYAPYQEVQASRFRAVFPEVPPPTLLHEGPKYIRGPFALYTFPRKSLFF